MKEIAFTPERWTRLQENARRWWRGELDRPLMYFHVDGRDPGRPAPQCPHKEFLSSHDFSITADEIVDRMDYELCRKEFLGDAFPTVWMNFGPGVPAAFMGARLDNANDTVWFHPPKECPITEVELKFDPQNPWFRRISELNAAAMRRWNGRVLVGLPDLGGILDILSSFRASGELMTDFYDDPEKVRELSLEIDRVWWHCYDTFSAQLRPVNPGWTAWTSLYSEDPYYIFQSDASYMIGPDMFREFVLPDLQACCKRIPNGFYHLDGIGELKHLDAILSIPELKGVQWVPGAGQPAWCHWPEVYRRIRDAGKLIQVYGGPETLDTLAQQLGSAKGIAIIGHFQKDREDELRECIRRYGAEA